MRDKNEDQGFMASPGRDTLYWEVDRHPSADRLQVRSSISERLFSEIPERKESQEVKPNL
jgi:hypothetical protein